MEPVASDGRDTSGATPLSDAAPAFDAPNGDGMALVPFIMSTDEMFAGPWDAFADGDEADEESEGDWSVVAAPERFVEPADEMAAENDDAEPVAAFDAADAEPVAAFDAAEAEAAESEATDSETAAEAAERQAADIEPSGEPESVALPDLNEEAEQVEATDDELPMAASCRRRRCRGRAGGRVYRRH